MDQRAHEHHHPLHPKKHDEHEAHHEHHARPQPPVAPQTLSGGKYTCPMHPQIVRDAPGDCPICGMALVPIGGATAQADDSELRDLTRRLWVGIALSVPW